MVFALTRKRAPRAARAGMVLAGFLVFAVPFAAPAGSIPAWRAVGSGFFPVDDQSEFIIKVETPPGSNLQYTRLKADEVARVVRARPEVRYTYATLGGGIGGGVDEGNIYVRLTPKGDREASAEDLAGLVRAQTARMAGATYSVFTNTFSGGRKQLLFQLRGPDVATISRAAEQVAAVVRSTPGAVDVGLSTKGQKPELNVELDRGVAGRSASRRGRSRRRCARRSPASTRRLAGPGRPDARRRGAPRARGPRPRRRPPAAPAPVSRPDGARGTVPLGQVARVTESVGPAIIDHLDRDLVVVVEGNTAGRAGGDVVNEVLARVGKLDLPPGVRFSLGGESKDQQEVFGQIFLALGTAVLLMYLVLVLQFGSFLDPIAIMLSLPLSLIGVFLALSITGSTINLMSLIGVILLAGIVAKNAILLLDFAKWAREDQGLPLREALIQAGAIRLRPILMTTFALIAGMVPVALGTGEGAQFRAPLGIAVIGGTLTSTLLTLLVVPTIYEVLDAARTARRGSSARAPRRRTAEHPVPGGAGPGRRRLNARRRDAPGPGRGLRGRPRATTRRRPPRAFYICHTPTARRPSSSAPIPRSPPSRRPSPRGP
jgi:HAE1 family hydrophobic/amphiphilic exporter-1